MNFTFINIAYLNFRLIIFFHPCAILHSYSFSIKLIFAEMSTFKK